MLGQQPRRAPARSDVAPANDSKHGTTRPFNRCNDPSTGSPPDCSFQRAFKTLHLGCPCSAHALRTQQPAPGDLLSPEGHAAASFPDAFKDTDTVLA